MSINPYWLMKILNGEKKLEIRKTIPNAKFPIDVYLYCTKGDVKGAKKTMTIPQLKMLGRVVAKFTLNKVEEIELYWRGEEPYYKTNALSEKELLDKSCLYTFEDMCNYVAIKGYAWYIDNLVIFKEAMWLHDFKLEKPPISWQFVEVEQ